MTAGKGMKIGGILRLLVSGLAILVWLIMNIRVEAGMASSFERTVDGLVGGALLLTAVFWAVSFFTLPPRERGKSDN